MSVARLIVRIMVATVLVLAVGTTAVLGFGSVLEPLYKGFGEPAASLGWGTPGQAALEMAAVAFLGILLVIIIWFVAAPIKSDLRQEFR